MSKTGLRSLWLAAAVAVGAMAVPGESGAQETFAWDVSQYFRFNIWQVALDVNPSGDKTRVTAVFSVTDPTNCTNDDPATCAPWDIKNDPEFKQPQGLSRLAIDVGWNTTDYENTGSAGEFLQPLVPQGKGAGAALPISINAVTASKPCNVVGAPAPCAASPLPFSATKYFVQTDLPKQATRTGVVAMEGHPAWPFTHGDGTTVWERVPVKSEFRYFAITDSPVPRREIVAIEKCMVCHDGEVHHDGVVIPRLSLHGANRTEELRVCVICHNPNQTDIPYRPAGAEVSIDFKRMVHSIHAGGFRKTPFSVVGFQGAIVDFSAVRFPARLSNCLTCHVEANGKGTFELPLASAVLGSTVSTGSTLAVPPALGSVDVNPANDRKITPIAAVCSSCHDEAEAQVHMSSRRQGGSFSALQSEITSGRIKERCVDCHGPGRDKDIRKVHQVRADELGYDFD